MIRLVVARALEPLACALVPTAHQSDLLPRRCQAIAQLHFRGQIGGRDNAEFCLASSKPFLSCFFRCERSFLEQEVTSADIGQIISRSAASAVASMDRIIRHGRA